MMIKKTTLLACAFSISTLAACGGGDSSSNEADILTNECIDAVTSGNGVEMTNNCGAKVNVLVLNIPNIRFSLEAGEIKFVNRNPVDFYFASCIAPYEPKPTSTVQSGYDCK